MVTVQKYVAVFGTGLIEYVAAESRLPTKGPVIVPGWFGVLG